MRFYPVRYLLPNFYRVVALVLGVDLVRGLLVADVSRDLEGPTKTEAAVAKMSWCNVCEVYVCACVCVCMCVRIVCCMQALSTDAVLYVARSRPHRCM